MTETPKLLRKRKFPSLEIKNVTIAETKPIYFLSVRGAVTTIGS